MTRVYDLVRQGGPLMYPLLGLSITTLISAFEQAFFWCQLLRQEDHVAHAVLEAARFDRQKAAWLALRAQSLPIGRFLLAPLKLKQPTSETFRLALEAAGEKEFARMRRGNKLFESVIALAPLLGLLGTVTGLITTFTHLNLGGGGTVTDTSRAAAGIGEALIATATGMIVAVMAVVCFRVFVALQARQIDYFSEVGNALELIYRAMLDNPECIVHDSNGTGQLKPPAPLVVECNQQGQLTLSKQRLTQTQLEQQVQSYLTQNPLGTVLLQASHQLPYEQVVQLLDAIRVIGGDRVVLAIGET